MTPADAVSGYLAYLRTERRASRNTLVAYEGDLESLLAFAKNSGIEDDICDVDLYALRKWLGELARTLAPSSVARRVAAIRSFMRWLLRRKVIPKNPAELLATPKVRRPLPTLLSVDAAQQVVEHPGDTPVGLRDRAVLELLYGSGLRVSELAGLSLAEVDLGGRSVRVIGKGDKERIAPLGKKSVEALEAYRAVRETFRH